MSVFRQFETNELKAKHENTMASSRFSPAANCKDGIVDIDGADGKHTR